MPATPEAIREALRILGKEPPGPPPLAEGFEFPEALTQALYAGSQVPQHIRQAALLAKKLHDASLAAFAKAERTRRDEDYRRAEDLDAKYAELVSRLEYAMSEIGFNAGHDIGGEEEKETAWDEATLERELASVYERYRSGQAAAALDQALLTGRLDAIQRVYAAYSDVLDQPRGLRDIGVASREVRSQIRQLQYRNGRGLLVDETELVSLLRGVLNEMAPGFGTPKNVPPARLIAIAKKAYASQKRHLARIGHRRHRGQPKYNELVLRRKLKQIQQRRRR